MPIESLADRAIILREGDDVAVAKVNIPAGTELAWNGGDRDLTIDQRRRDSDFHCLACVPAVGEFEQVARMLNRIADRCSRLDLLGAFQHLGGEQFAHLLHRREVGFLISGAALEHGFVAPGAPGPPKLVLEIEKGMIRFLADEPPYWLTTALDLS